MRIKVSKTILESALIFKAKKDVRYYLCGICFKVDGRVFSTDGHRAFIGEKHEGELAEDVIISISKPPIKAYHHVDIDIESGIVSYYDFLEKRVGVGICEVIDGKFPDLDRIIQKETSPCDRIGFNAKYLADIDKAAKLFNPKWESVVFELNGNTKAATANLKSPHGEIAKILVMPMRID